MKSNPQFCYIKHPSAKIQRAIGETTHFWNTGETITYYFIGGTIQQREFVRSRLRKIQEFINLNFTETATVSNSDVRISFVEGIGSWSYIGKVARLISKNNATMNFGWLSKTNPSPQTNLVDHELGHMIGAGHEHKFPGWIKWNEERVYADMEQQGWSREQTYHNILKPYLDTEITSTGNADVRSVMLYIFPKEWTLDEMTTSINFEFSESEKAFWSDVYPFDDIVEEEVEPEVCVDPRAETYRRTLKLIFCNSRFTNAAIRLPLFVNREVAKELGVSDQGSERAIILRIKNKLEEKTT